MRIFRTFLFLVAFFSLWSFAIPTASAQSFPNPLPRSFLVNGYYYDGTLDDFWVVLEVNYNLGYVSSHGLRSAEFNTQTINPHAITQSQQLSLKWGVQDDNSWVGPNVTGCEIKISSEDSGNSYSNTLSSIGTSGGMSFNSAALTPGNYLFLLRCNLDNGKILKDFVYVYLLPSSVTPAPVPQSFLAGAHATNGYSISLLMNANLGIASGRNYTAATINTEPMNPIAFTSSQLNSSTIRLNVGYPPNWQFWQPYISKCVFTVSGYRGGRFTEVYRDEIVETPITSQTLPNPPMSFADANLDFGIICNLSNGRTVSDFLYIYQVPGSGGGPPPPGGTVEVDVNASPLTINKGQSTTVSWISDGTSCTDSRGGSYAASSSFTDSPSSTKTYGMTCVRSGWNSGTDSVTVTVGEAPKPPLGAPVSGPAPSVDIKGQ